MPTYLYYCSEENKELEIEHKISETIELCPHCKENGKETPLKKLIAGGGSFILNGGGWASSGYS